MAFLRNNNPRGQFLIEVLIAIGLFVLFAGTFAMLSVDALNIIARTTLQSKAYLRAHETQDALISIWQTNPDLLTTGSHGLALQGQLWTLTGSPDTTDHLERSIAITSATRDAQGQLAMSGTIDVATKKVTTTITHDTSTTVLFEEEMYFPTIGPAAPPSGLFWQESTVADFQDGTFTSTQTTNNNGGEITLAVGQTQGTYLSSRFNTGSTSTTYSALYWNGVFSATSDIRIQIRVTQNQGQLNSASWFGPDGTSGTYFQNGDSITIPGSVSGTRWVQYRIQFTRSDATIPRLDEITIYYAQ